MHLNPIEKTRQNILGNGGKIINLSSGLTEVKNLAFPKQILQKGLKKFQKNPQYNAESKGLLSARKAVSDFYKKRRLRSLSPEQIILTSGTSESYFEIFKLLAKPGEEILFPNPAYPLFENLANLAGVKISFYHLDPHNKWQINTKNLISNINSKTKAIVLISPNNPTGSVLNENSLQEVIKIANIHQLPIISDEVFSELMFDEKQFPRVATLTKNSTVFTLNGISKTYTLPGLKLSWIVVTGQKWPSLVEELEYITDTFLTCNQISQELLPDIIHAGGSFITQHRKYLEHNRNMAIEILSRHKNITFHKPEAGPYIFLNIKNLNMSDENFVIELMKTTGIFVHPGYFYDYEEGVNILISFVMEEKKLQECLEKIVKFISEKI